MTDPVQSRFGPGDVCTAGAFIFIRVCGFYSLVCIHSTTFLSYVNTPNFSCVFEILSFFADIYGLVVNVRYRLSAKKDSLADLSVDAFFNILRGK